MDKDKKLLSITDENTILITARFEDSKNGTKSLETLKHYDIELIVKKDITCNQLLEAIYYGLQKKIVETNPTNVISVEYSRMDSRRPETETITSKNSPAGDFGDEKESLASIYTICFDIFNRCYHYYNNPRLYKNIAPHKSELPCISIGGINFRVLPDDTQIAISHEEQVNVTNDKWGEKRLDSIGFMTGTRIVFDNTGANKSAAIFQGDDITEAYKTTIPLYNISDRPLYTLENDEVRIISPTDPPQKSKQDILTTILSPILMMGAMTAARMVSGAGFGKSSLAMYGAMAVVSLLLGGYGIYRQNNDYKKNLEEWREHYKNYISRLIKDIKQKQEDDVNKLQGIYPAKMDHKDPLDVNNQRVVLGLVGKANHVDGDIYSRSHEHPDFLSIRLGLSNDTSELVPSVFPIVGDKKDAVFSDMRYIGIDGIESQPFDMFIGQEVSPESKDPYLVNLPADIAKKYAYLHNAPVVLKLRDCGALGVVFPENMSFSGFLDNIILDLCFYQSPDDVQIILFCDEESDWRKKQSIISKYKHLPHFRELIGDISPFVFSAVDADRVLNKLLEVLTDRKQADKGTHFPHIVLVFAHEYDQFKRHPVAEYLPQYSEKEETNAKNEEISFIFFKRYREELPKYCGNVIEAKNDKEWYLIPHKLLVTRDESVPNTSYIPHKVDDLGNEIKETWTSSIYNDRYCFTPDEQIAEDDEDGQNAFYRAFKILSALYYFRIAQGAGVPEYIDLYNILSVNEEATVSVDEVNLSEEELKTLEGLKEPELQTKIEELKINKYRELRLAKLQRLLRAYIAKTWQVNLAFSKKAMPVPLRDITKSLAVPIGRKSDDPNSSPVLLDLHEKADGPHMLVAGTTGSGKTETILTYLIGLCALYTPDQVNLLLMDMKGAGFVKRIGDLPHVVGKVTDVDGDENGTSMEYMLKRFLHSMNAEVKRRKVLLSRMGVDSLDGYIKAKSNLSKFVKDMKLSPSEEKRKYAELSKLDSLAHLFLVVDEFTELMRFSSDNSDVDFKSEITSLARIGRSLGFHIILISQNIESAITDDIRVNSKARLCLKVATREASREMIGTDIAYGPLMPGNGRAYLWIGGGARFDYFQSAYSGADGFQNIAQPVVITFAEMSGEYSLFYNSEEDKKELIKTLSDEQNDNIHHYSTDVGADVADGIDAESAVLDSEDITNDEDVRCFNVELKKAGREKEQQFNVKAAKLDSTNSNEDSQVIVETSLKHKELAAMETIKSDKTQIDLIAKAICEIFKILYDYKLPGNKRLIYKPHKVFQQPLPTKCYFDFSWDDNDALAGNVVDLKRNPEEIVKVEETYELTQISPR